MTTILVVAPHPDDELLGCGGTVLRHVAEGDAVHWMVVTAMTEPDFDAVRIAARARELDSITRGVGFVRRHELGFRTAWLDEVPRSSLIAAIGAVIEDIEPEIVYLPWPGDVHSDHRIVHEVGIACTKWFRHSSVRGVLSYEVLSETDQAAATPGFQPQCFVDISVHLERKIELLSFYEGEIGQFPFPRSEAAVRALAAVRGAASGFPAAEAFEVVRHRR